MLHNLSSLCFCFEYGHMLLSIDFLNLVDIEFLPQDIYSCILSQFYIFLFFWIGKLMKSLQNTVFNMLYLNFRQFSFVRLGERKGSEADFVIT